MGFDSCTGERARIAQELHDTLLQGFFAASMRIHAAIDSLPADCSARTRVAGALLVMDRALEEGRRAVQGLRSPDRSLASLGQTLASVPKDLDLPAAVEFRVVVEGRQRELRAGLSDEIYCIGREAIFNAYRHARAKQIDTEIECGPTGLRMAVRDDGCGIDPQALRRTGHWGLCGMRERAERIGAQLRILSRITMGTEIELCVPGRVAFERG